MRSWEPPTEQTIRTALQRIRSPDFEAYFFAKLKNPTWIAPLAARGVFSSPPEPVDSADNGTIFPSWQASKYLVRMAPHAPSEVVSVLEQLDTRNPNVAGDIIQAALAVPVEFASRLVPSIVRAAQAHEPSFHYSQAGVDFATVAKRMGHGLNLHTTALYTRWSPEGSHGKVESAQRRIIENADSSKLADSSVDDIVARMEAEGISLEEIRKALS